MGGKVRLEDRACPLSTALGYVGEWWTMLILHDCFDGYSRFDQFQANIGLSSSMLTSRLKTLVADGILEKRLYQERPPRHEYLLTPRGRSLRPVLVAMAAWTNSQLAPEDRTMILVDECSGREIEPELVDGKTGERLDNGVRHVFTAGPAASPTMKARYTARAPSGVTGSPAFTLLRTGNASASKASPLETTSTFVIVFPSKPWRSTFGRTTGTRLAVVDAGAGGRTVTCV